MRRGFTLIELLIVLGMMGIIAVIVLVAINPNKQLCDARRAKRQSDERQLMNALQQYLLKNLSPVANDVVLSGESNAQPICKYQVSDPTCVSLDALVPTYVADMPQDPQETNANYTGYKIYKDLFGRQIVNSDRDSVVCSKEETSS